MTDLIFRLNDLIQAILACKARGGSAIIAAGDDPTAVIVRKFCAGFGLPLCESGDSDAAALDAPLHFISWRARHNGSIDEAGRAAADAGKDIATFFFPMTTWSPAWFLTKFPDALTFNDWSIRLSRDTFMKCIDTLFDLDPAPPFAAAKQVLRRNKWRTFRRFPDIHADTRMEALSPQRSKLYGSIIKDFDTVAANMPVIRKVTDALSDGASRTQYRRLFSGNHRMHWESYFENFLYGPQYFDCVEYQHVKNILNLGIYTGEEIPVFRDQIATDGCIVNVDPGGDSCLPSEIANFCKDHEDTITFNQSFVGNGEEISYIAKKTGEYVVVDPTRSKADGRAKAKSIPELIAESGVDKIDLIKTDVEGIEEDIIDQIADYAAANRCQIALSIYHTEEHHWSLPARLIDALDNYLFFYRGYSWARYEGIFYCVPAECRRENPISLRLVD